MGHDEQRWPCQSSHLFAVSMDGVKPLTITLPYPILPSTIKATLYRKDGIVEVVAAKALNDLWPEDVIRDQFRWNPDTLLPWTDVETMQHLGSRFRPLKLGTSANGSDALGRICMVLHTIFTLVVKKKKLLIALCDKEENTEWLIRVHLPVRTSPRGGPLLLLTALDRRQVARLQSEGKWDRGEDDFKLIFESHGLPDKIEMILLESDDGKLFRHILRFNSTKIQPSSWQKKNLPQGGDSPWLATFIRPLYLDANLCADKDPIPLSSPAASCCRCGKQGPNLKVCGRCKAVSYCSVECQRSHWSEHKLSCSKL